jgi:hypothetical protein
VQVVALNRRLRVVQFQQMDRARAQLQFCIPVAQTFNPQRGGSIPAAVVNEVSAVVKRLAPLLAQGGDGNLSEIHERLFENRRAFETAQRTQHATLGVLSQRLIPATDPSHKRT